MSGVGRAVPFMQEMFTSHLAETKGQCHKSEDTVLNGDKRGHCLEGLIDNAEQLSTKRWVQFTWEDCLT